YVMDKIFSGIETRIDPPLAVPWPLAIGKTWQWRYTRQRPIDRSSTVEVRDCAVDKQEQLSVPAGVFEALKVVCSDPRTSRVTSEVWYSPKVGSSVKERTMFDYGVRDRELMRYRVE